MEIFKKPVRKYSEFVANHPILVLIAVIVITYYASVMAANVGVKSMDYQNMLPDEVEAVYASNVISDQFGGSDSAMIAITLDPNYAVSDEPIDIRDLRVITYIDILTKATEKIDNVDDTTSISTILRSMNSGRLPKTDAEIIEQTKSNLILGQYINLKYNMAIIRIELSDRYEEKELLNEITKLINELPKPSGLRVEPAGEVLSRPIMNDQIGPDVAKTSQVSFIGIVVILLVMLRSFVFGLTPLTVITVGVIWAFGYFGIMQMSLSSASSGAVSMIMGVGIDFGIQIVTRYRYELKKLNSTSAMETTLSNVILPMLTTTLAALIGFQAMSMGQLSIMRELGSIMSYGILACFLVSITLVPAILLLVDKTKFKIKMRRRSQR